MEDRLRDLERQVKKLAEQQRQGDENLTVFVTNYKSFSDSIEERIKSIDRDSRNFERATCEWGQDMESNKEAKEDGEYSKILSEIFKTDLKAREKEVVDKIVKLIPSGQKSNGGGNLLQIVNFFLIIIVIAWLAYKNFM